MLNKLSPLEREWNAFLRKEEKAVKRYEKVTEPFWEKKLKTVIPEQVREKLEAAFYTAFKAILKNGLGTIEKTYSKERLQAEFKTREYAQTVLSTRKNLAACRKNAGKQTVRNVAFSGAEGAVLGILGIGLPDIPLFLAMVFRSLYTLALHYGIDYESSREQELLLELLALSLYRGADFKKTDAQMNQKLYRMASEDRVKRGRAVHQRNEGTLVLAEGNVSELTIKNAAKAMSGELLYLKFLQGIPIAGIIGGLYDGIYLKKITDYAALKMERRYLLSKMEPGRQ